MSDDHLVEWEEKRIVQSTVWTCKAAWFQLWHQFKRLLVSMLCKCALPSVLHYRKRFLKALHEMRFFKITGFLMASFYPENEFQKAINAEMNPKIPVYLQRSSASSPPRRSRVFQWSPGWPSAGAATSAWCNRCRRTQLLHRQTNKRQADLMLLINMIKCFYKSNKLSCTNYYTKI